MSFLVHKVTNVAHWFAWIASLHLNVLCELGCKEQFNKIRPEWITGHMKEAGKWLQAHRQWRSTNLMCSVCTQGP